MRGKAHDDATKAQVMAALLAGQSISEVAAAYHVPEGTIKHWSAEVGAVELVQPQKKQEIGDLLLEYLRQNLTTLSVQQQHFRDAAWLTKQDAADLAVLHGVSMDKAIKILEALERASEPDGSAGLDAPAGAADGGAGE